MDRSLVGAFHEIFKKIVGTTESSKIKEVTTKWPYFGYNI